MQVTIRFYMKAEMAICSDKMSHLHTFQGVIVYAAG